ncbi:TetR/AcrR family transcriptional regulator [Streptosporangium saharense]|uniref:TetR/AcrR family transcriptional regulator n=1 Tax=Streptosporangium saharense TaxID=1706840 RepID=UPI00333333CF
MPTRARERLLDTAEELFYSQGVRAVGVEQILTVSKVGRASFYRHFPGKEDLVVAVLERRDRRWREWLAERVAAHGGGPLAVFDALAERFADAGFRGCAFINTMVEAADPTGAAHRVAADHKRRVTRYVESLLTAAGHQRAAVLAPQLVMLMDGAIVTALRERSADPALRARTIADALVGATGEPAAP